MGALLDAALFAYSQNPVPGARMHQGTAQGIATNALTTVSFDTVDFDTSGNAIASTSAHQLIANRTGMWAISATITFATTATQNGKWFWAGFSLNGSTAGAWGNDSTLAYNGTFNTTVSFSDELRLAAGDAITVLADQNSGASVNTAPGGCFMSMAFTGPA